MKIKLPTFKDLNLNLKEILWKNNFKTFEAFKNAYISRFCARLREFLKENDILTPENFKTCYTIIFYYGYVNYQKEKNLKEFLEQRGFKIQVTTLKYDAIYGIDLIATKNENINLIQVKSKLHNADTKKLKSLYKDNPNINRYIAAKIKNVWNFLNVETLELTTNI